MKEKVSFNCFLSGFIVQKIGNIIQQGSPVSAGIGDGITIPDFIDNNISDDRSFEGYKRTGILNRCQLYFLRRSIHKNRFYQLANQTGSLFNKKSIRYGLGIKGCLQTN